jgi:integrase
MAAPVQLKNGKWRGQIRKVGFKEVTKQFATKTACSSWLRKTEMEMEQGITPESKSQTISDIILKYRQARDVNRPVKPKSTEDYTLMLLDNTLGEWIASKMTVEDLIGWATERREDAGGYKVNCDLSKLATVLRYVSPTLLPILEKARPKLEYLGLIQGAGQRERRPTDAELQSILVWLEQHEGVVVRDFVEFAGLTAMRRSEIAGLRWMDLSATDRTILVRDRKDPRQKIGNDQTVPLLAGSFEIILRQLKIDELIFPVRPKHLTKVFHDACIALGIEDLHLHDMRHHGISLMFEHGYDIHQVSIVSGHKNWAHLKRYTQIKPVTLHLLDTRQGTPPRPDNLQIEALPQDTS